jgi:hypothetical protein
MPAKYLLSLALIICLNTAWAHSFNIVLIAPHSQFAGQSTLKGFLLATREQDAHQDEESDGHLGGLDSYILNLDSQPGEEDLSGQIEIRLRESEIPFAVGQISPGVRAMFEDRDIVVIDPVFANFWAAAIAEPGQIKLMNGRSFSIAFEEAYGYSPDFHAIHGYLAARVIALVVRNFGEQVLSNPQSLKQVVEQVLQEPSL